MRWNLEAARWVLGRLPAERMPDLAVGALQEGVEIESLVRLAGLHRPTAAEAAPLFETALRELGETLPGQEEAVKTLATEAANMIMTRTTSPGEGAKRLAELARYLDPAPEALLVFVGLSSEFEDFGDAIRLGYYGAEHCAVVRDQVERAIIEAAAGLAKSERAG